MAREKLTPGEASFMRSCQTQFPPVHCPTVLIGEGLRDRGFAVFKKTYSGPSYWPHSGTWVLTDAGRQALAEEAASG